MSDEIATCPYSLNGRCCAIGCDRPGTYAVLFEGLKLTEHLRCAECVQSAYDFPGVVAVKGPVTTRPSWDELPDYLTEPDRC